MRQKYADLNDKSGVLVNGKKLHVVINSQLKKCLNNDATAKVTREKADDVLTGKNRAHAVGSSAPHFPAAIVSSEPNEPKSGREGVVRPPLSEHCDLQIRHRANRDCAPACLSSSAAT